MSKTHRLFYRDFGKDGLPDLALNAEGGDDCYVEIKDGEADKMIRLLSDRPGDAKMTGAVPNCNYAHTRA